MSTDTTQGRRVLIATAVIGPVAIIVGGWLLLRGSTPGNMAGGFLSGGLASLVAVGVMHWRTRRSPQRATSFERAWTQAGDERDDAVLTRALAVLGLVCLPMAGVAGIAVGMGVGMGVDPSMATTLLVFGEIVVLAAAFVVINRHS